MKRRAFTILEVLIVVALLVAITAMAGPALARWMRPRLFEEACAQIQLAARVAAEEARETATPVALVARPMVSPRDIELVLIPLDEVQTDDTLAEPSIATSRAADRSLPEATAFFDLDAEQNTKGERVITLRSPMRFVPRDMLDPFISDAPLASPSSDPTADPAPALDLEAFLEADTRQTSDWVVAIALPSGELAPGDPVVFVGRGAYASVEVSPLADRLILTPNALTTTRDEADDDAEPEEPTDDPTQAPDEPVNGAPPSNPSPNDGATAPGGVS